MLAANEVNPPADIAARPGDLVLTPAELRQLSLFRKIMVAKNMPKFEQHPGAVVLRRYQAGDVIFRQGEAGYTAFYILTTDDLRQLQKYYPELGDLRLPGEGPHDPGKIMTVQLAVARTPEPQPEKATLWERLGWKRPRRAPRPESRPPASIPFDGPADIDYDTLQAEMRQGELFGEAGCLDGIPRSAAVLAERTWYILEMLRNILTDLQRDEGYQHYQDQLYKQRGLGIHLRKFSIFRDLPDEHFQPLLAHLVADLDSDRPEEEKPVALISRKHGQVICDEHDVADSMYIIRSGLVKVIKNVSPLLGPEDVTSWPALCRCLTAREQAPETPQGTVWQRLGLWHNALRGATEMDNLRAEDKEALLDALNNLIRDAAFYDGGRFREVVEQAGLAAEARAVPQDRAKWPRPQLRRFNRRLLEGLFPGAFRQRGGPDDPPLILSYRSRGETIGEMGVVLRRPRIATCVAFVHENSKRGEVRLLRIRAEALTPFLQPGSPLQTKLEQVAAERREETRAIQTGAVKDRPKRALQSESFKALGLIQGQKLMLIDLDRCTRCDECVRACVATHADGRSRLFLDGPRYGQPAGSRDKSFLVPTTCRSCLNPECMMGCPVGSIHRGNKGEIVIEDWCIGCRLCAEYCPYGAIQMHDIGLVPENVHGWRYRAAREAPAGRWHQAGFPDRGWPVGATPFAYDSDFQAGLGGPLPQGEAVCFRYTFQRTASRDSAPGTFRLKVTSADAAVAVWLDGQAMIVPGQPGPTREKVTAKGWWEIEADLDAAALSPGEHMLAVRAAPAGGSTGVLLNLGLYEVRPPAGAASAPVLLVPKIVEQQAVVCDLCSALPDGPACVKACPHEAAFRFDARLGVPVQ